MVQRVSFSEPKMTSQDMLSIVHDKERRALAALISVYGEDISQILNGLHGIAARLAIAAGTSGTSSEEFTAGVKHHWDFLVEAINDDRPSRLN
jgi:plasmid maintenance system antidote protein VapI